MAEELKRKGDTLYNILDYNTGESLEFKKTTTYTDGTSMTDGKVDGVIYIKRAGEYFERGGDAIKVESYGYNTTNNTSYIQAAINNPFRKILSNKRELIISSPITIPVNKVVLLENTVIKASASFVGEYMVRIIGGNVGNTLSINLNLDGNNVSGLVGVKFDGSNQITGNFSNIQVKNLDVGVWVVGNIERQNINVFAYNCNLALKETRDINLSENLTPDENYYRITGSGCKQWFYQSGECSSQVNFNVENTAAHTDYAVVIEGNKYVSLTGELRGNNNGAIKINGGTSLNVHLDLICIIVENGMALNAISARSINGSLITEKTNSEAIYLGNISNGSILDLNVKGHTNGTVLTIGGATDNFQRGKINYCSYPINDTSKSINLVRANLLQLNVVATNTGIDIPANAVLGEVTIDLPSNIITSNIPITNGSAYLPIFNIRGRLSTTQIAAYSTPLSNMHLKCVSDKFQKGATYNSGAWRYDSDINGSRTPVSVKTANYTITTQDVNILFDATSGNLVASLPTAASCFSNGIGQEFTIKKMDVSANTVTVAGNSIDGQPTYVLPAQWNFVKVQSIGTGWIIIGK